MLVYWTKNVFSIQFMFFFWSNPVCFFRFLLGVYSVNESRICENSTAGTLIRNEVAVCLNRCRGGGLAVLTDARRAITHSISYSEWILYCLVRTKNNLKTEHSRQKTDICQPEREKERDKQMKLKEMNDRLGLVLWLWQDEMPACLAET